MSYKYMIQLVSTIVFLTIPAIGNAQGTAIAPGDVVEGTAEGVNVSYIFKANEGDSFTFSIDSDFSSVLTVEGENGAIYVNNEDLRYSDLPMLFTAPEAGQYTLVVDASFGDPQGNYTIEMNAAEVTTVEYGDSVEMNPESELVYYFDFQGSAGDVVNIYANSADDDSRLRLMQPNGTLVFTDDDNGPGYDPYIRRYELPNDGRYVVMLSSLTDSYLLETPITFYIEQTENLIISDEPTAIELGGTIDGDTDIEVLVFDEAQVGQTYQFSIDTGRADTEITVNVYQGGDNISNTTFESFVRGTFDFIAQSNSRIILEVDLYGSSGEAIPIDVSLTNVDN